MRLYYHPLSSNSRRAVLTALHLGTRLDLTVVDLLKGEHRGEAFLALNPNAAAQLPVGGFVHLQAWFARVQALEAWKQSQVR
ncbi:MAG TPA: hypothetical protein VLX44_10385 [Xanthobacteraceae bacterium]|nr:hypothetical protein [Xanthobacteraceae bacterium]